MDYREITNLRKYAEHFSKSEPRFALRLSPSGSTVNAVVADKYIPTPVSSEPLAKLVCEKYKESFSMSRHEYDMSIDGIVDDTMREIRRIIISSVKVNLGMKNPRQSKLYRWLVNDMPKNNIEFNSGLILLYNYIKQNCTDNFKANSLDHANNIILIVDSMRIKNEKK